MKLLLILTIAALLNINTVVSAHENEVFKHKPMPGCYGWVVLDDTMRLCYLDREHKMCVKLIHTHGAWHVTEPFECQKEEENE